MKIPSASELHALQVTDSAGYAFPLTLPFRPPARAIGERPVCLSRYNCNLEVRVTCSVSYERDITNY